MKTLTFFRKSVYAGGRSHRNINTLEFIEGKNMIEAAEYLGYNLYPAENHEDFDGGAFDSNGNEVMDEKDYEEFNKTGIGYLSFGEANFCTMALKDIGIDEFKALQIDLKLDYVNLWNEDVTIEMLEEAINVDSEEYVFEYGEEQWQVIRENL